MIEIKIAIGGIKIGWKKENDNPKAFKKKAIKEPELA